MAGPWYTPVSDDEPGKVQVSLNQRHADELVKPNSFGRHIIAKAVAFKLGLPDPASAVSRSNYAENTSAYTVRSPFWKPAQTIALISSMVIRLSIQVR